MQVGRIKNATRILGKSQGYLGLPIRDEIINETNHGKVPAMVSAWFPTPKELENLNRGGAIYLKILGQSHPPVILEVEDVSERKELKQEDFS